MDDVEQFIELIRTLDAHITTACLRGSCYKFYKVLSRVYPDATPYMNTERNHVVTRIGNSLYDITGRVGSVGGKAADKYHRMDETEIRVAQKWHS